MSDKLFANLDAEGNSFILSFLPEQAELNERVIKNVTRTCPSATFSQERSSWIIDDSDVVHLAHIASYGKLSVSRAAFDLLSRDERIAAKRLSFTAPRPPLPSVSNNQLHKVGLNGNLREDQLEGVAEILSRRRVLLADMTGMGKTVQCLSAVAMDRSYPAVVVCQAALKYKWENEVKRWFPGASSCVVEGRSRERIRPANIIIISYDIMHYRLADLLELEPRSIVVDESQFIKEQGPSKQSVDRYLNALSLWEGDKSKRRGKKPSKPRGSWRTYAVTRVASRCDGLRILASATPVPNRHKELWSQIQALGLEEYFGGWKSFHVRFCGGRMGKFGWEIDKSTNSPELHQRLKETCLIRRRMSGADLREARHENIPLPLAEDKMAEYRRAEEDIIEYMSERAAELARSLGQNVNSAAVAAAIRAESAKEMVQMSALRRLAGEAKVNAAILWVQDFLKEADYDVDDDGNEVRRKIVVFAYHREVQRLLVEGLDALWVRASQEMRPKEMSDIVQRFNNDDDCRVLVSTQGAKVGHDLTGAHNMAIIEPPWTWDDVIQMLGRIYGRANDPHGATLYHLLGAGTIDERISRLLYKKRSQSLGALDGVFNTEAASAGSSRSVVGDLLVEYAREQRSMRKASTKS